MSVSSILPLVLLRWPGGNAAQRQHLGPAPALQPRICVLSLCCSCLKPARQLFSCLCLTTDPHLAVRGPRQLANFSLSYGGSHGKAHLCSSKLAQQHVVLAVLSCEPGPNLTPQKHGQVSALSREGIGGAAKLGKDVLRH